MCVCVCVHVCRCVGVSVRRCVGVSGCRRRVRRLSRVCRVCLQRLYMCRRRHHDSKKIHKCWCVSFYLPGSFANYKNINHSKAMEKDLTVLPPSTMRNLKRTASMLSLEDPEESQAVKRATPAESHRAPLSDLPFFPKWAVPVASGEGSQSSPVASQSLVQMQSGARHDALVASR